MTHNTFFIPNIINNIFCFEIKPNIFKSPKITLEARNLGLSELPLVKH